MFNLKRLFTLIFIWLLGVAYFYRKFFLSGFNQTIGDQGDGRFVALVTDHWYQVVNGDIDWKSLNIFFPTSETIGLSDLNILLSVPHLVFRFIGFDIFLSFLLSTIFITLIGYFSLYFLLTKYLKVDFSIAIFSSFLFTFSSPNVIALSSHPQLFTIYLLPGFLIGVAKILQCKERRLLYIFGTFTLFGLIFSTSVYVFVFTLISLILFLFIYLAFEIQTIKLNLRFSPKIILYVIVALFSLVLGMSPGLRVYLPIREQRGGRDFSEIIEYLPSPINIINIGSNNLVWSKVLDRFDSLLNIDLGSGELSLNPTPIFVLVTLILCVLTYKRDRLPTVFFSTALLIFILISKFGEFSAWKILHQIIGFDSIRAIGRFNLLINLILILSFAISSNLVLKQFKKHKIVILLAAFIISMEQVQVDNNFSIIRSEQSVKTQLAKGHPKECRVFYLNSSLTDIPQAFIQNDAFLVAQVSGIPTLNGYSGIYPSNWNLNSVGDPSYLGRVGDYIKSQRIGGTVCELNISESKWYVISNPYIEGNS